MTPLELIAKHFASNLDFLKQTIGDFTDADMLVRPVPAANHAAWQLGHLLSFETMVCGMYAPAAAPKLPDGFDNLHGKEGSKVDDAARFLKKDEMLKLLDQAHGGLVTWLRSLTPADLDKPGPEQFKGWVATIGDLVMTIPMHSTMHVGQFQVIRRKLGKKVLF